MADDPTIAAARDVIGHGLEELRKGVDGLTVDELNARPGGGETNPVAVIVVHALASTRSWLSLAVGAPLPPRDRPSEFRTVAGEGFADEVDAAITTITSLLEDPRYDPARTGTAPWRSHGADEPVTAAWALLHAAGHLGEHVGHLHMTRELLRPAG